MAVNIIIPIYNTAPELFERALYSLAAQTKRGFLTTVVDDCSSSENRAQYLRIIERMPFNIRYLSLEKNSGPGYARQYAMDNAYPSVDYFMFLDADDILTPRAVEILYSEAKINDADLVNSNILIEGKHRSSSGIIPLGSNTTWMHGKIYKKDFLGKNGIRFLNEKIYNEDSYFNLIVLCLAEKKFNIEESFYIWSYNKDSITRVEGVEDFGKLYGYDYFYSQIKALHFLLEKTEMNFGPTLGNIYNTFQDEMIHNPQNMYKMENALFELFQIPYIKKHLDDDEIIAGFIQKAQVGKDGFLFKQCAHGWICQYRGDYNE